jgi:hypothetical protein
MLLRPRTGALRHRLPAPLAVVLALTSFGLVWAQAQTNLTTTTTIGSSSSTGWYVGMAVTFTASVSPGTAGGVVDFYAGGTLIGSGTVINGNATFTTSQLAPGTNSISATYLGAAGYSSSTSPTLTYIVGNVYYVATNGSDANNGLATNSAFQTFQHAANQVHAGDAVWVLEGIYTNLSSHLSITNHSGSASGWITFSSYPGQQAIFCGVSGQMNGKGIVVSNVGYIKIQNLNFRDMTNQGIYVQGPGSNYCIVGNTTSNTWQSGIAVWGVAVDTSPDQWDFKAITNVVVASNIIDNACGPLGTNYGYEEALDIANGVDHFWVYGNLIKNGSQNPHGAEGIDIKDGNCNGWVYNNETTNLCHNSIYLDGGEDYTNYYVTPGLSTNINIYNNRCHHNGTPQGVGTIGICIDSEGRGSLDTINVYNNVCYSNGSAGIQVLHWNGGGAPAAGTLSNIWVYNNTLFGNCVYDPNHGGLAMTYTDAVNAVVYNNLSTRSTYGNDFQTEPCWQVTNNMTGLNPATLFRNWSNADFHLIRGSPAIDKAIKPTNQTGFAQCPLPTIDADGAPRPGSINLNYDSNYDIGAYEYHYPAAPTLQLQLTNGQSAELTLQGTFGGYYNVQYAETLNGTNGWNLLQDFSPLPGMSIQFTDPTPAATLKQRFYRAVAVP